MPGSRNRAAFSIAGSDPSGGAGIQADLKTFTALGVYGAAAITCLTAQNSLGIAAILPVEPDFVRRQIELALSDLPVSHIKTGMLGNDWIAGIIAQTLSGFDGELICDPVLSASCGHRLFLEDPASPGLAALLAKATVLTPNLPELGHLTGLKPSSPPEALAAARSLLDRLPKLRALILTGGHLDEQAAEVRDFLLLRSAGGVEILSSQHPRINTRNSHGTGCTFASAFTAYHLRYGDYRQAFLAAADYVAELLNLSADLDLGQGKGPLAHHLLRSVSEES